MGALAYNARTVAIETERVSGEAWSRRELDHVQFQGVPAPASPRLPQVSRERAAGTVGEPEPCLDPLAAWLLARCGLDPAAYRAQPLNRRLPAVLRATAAADAAQARELLSRRPELVSGALAALLISVTSFARDAGVFAAIAQDAIPQLAAREGPLRVWSAGCANGAELYTAALLFTQAGLLGRAELLGTDCRPDVIAAAVTACYQDDDLDRVPASLRARYFVAGPEGSHPVPALARRVRWKVADVTSAVEDGPWHMILCRNLAIYLAPPAAASLWRRLTAQLADGGFLVVGKAEHPSCSGLVRSGPSLYRKIVAS